MDVNVSMNIHTAIVAYKAMRSGCQEWLLGIKMAAVKGNDWLFLECKEEDLMIKPKIKSSLTSHSPPGFTELTKTWKTTLAVNQLQIHAPGHIKTLQALNMFGKSISRKKQRSLDLAEKGGNPACSRLSWGLGPAQAQTGMATPKIPSEATSRTGREQQWPFIHRHGVWTCVCVSL